jgi:8-oxo-dGTP diphosphatase
MTLSSIPAQTIGTVVVIVSKGKVLIGKRKNSYMSGYYGLPGGRLESNEKLVDCAMRELTEETGIKTNNLKYLGVIKDQNVGFSFIHFAFLCKKFKGEPSLMEEDKCEGWEWFDPKHIPSKTLVGHKAAIDVFLHLGKTPAYREISSV